MRRNNHIIEREQRIVGIGRLLFEDIETGPRDTTGGERGGEHAR